MNRLFVANASLLTLLCEGSSMRSVSRVVDVSINTVTRELIQAGKAYFAFHDLMVRGVQSKRVQADEIWSFVEMKERRVRQKIERSTHVGDIWTWTAIDADSEFIISWYAGARDAEAAYAFVSNLASRLANRVQLTTDEHHVFERSRCGL